MQFASKVYGLFCSLIIISRSSLLSAVHCIGLGILRTSEVHLIEITHYGKCLWGSSIIEMSYLIGSWIKFFDHILIIYILYSSWFTTISNPSFLNGKMSDQYEANVHS